MVRNQRWSIVPKKVKLTSAVPKKTWSNSIATRVSAIDIEAETTKPSAAESTDVAVPPFTQREFFVEETDTSTSVPAAHMPFTQDIVDQASSNADSLMTDPQDAITATNQPTKPSRNRLRIIELESTIKRIEQAFVEYKRVASRKNSEFGGSG